MDPEDEDALDKFISSAVCAGKSKETSVEPLRKNWCIHLGTAERTLEVTSQNESFSENTTFHRNHPTNDRMLRNKRIKNFL